MQKSKLITIIVITVLLLCYIVYAIIGYSSFKGGDYKDATTNVAISFKEGQFIVNGKEVGSYSCFYDKITVYFEKENIKVKGTGIIKDNLIMLNFPDMPGACLVKVVK